MWDLEIDRAGFFAIMGPSGSGKTKLLHLLAGLDRADEGEVEVSGIQIGSLGERGLTKFRREGVGIVFQQFNLIPTMTALQNVELPGVLAKQNGAALRERAGGLLERLGVSGRADHRPDAMSGGEQQRVAIARAMLFEPRGDPGGRADGESGFGFFACAVGVARGVGGGAGAWCGDGDARAGGGGALFGCVCAAGWGLYRVVFNGVA